MHKFTVQEIERTIEFADDDSGDHEEMLDAGEHEPASLADVLDAFDSQCWDHADDRGDGTLILYPADSTTNLRTGADESTQLIVKARRPEWMARAIALYEARGGAL